MTDLEKAARQALLVLDICNQQGYVPVRGTQKAIIDLRVALASNSQALEQPAQREDWGPGPHEYHSLREQPVAWQCEGKLIVREDWVSLLNWSGDFVAVNRGIPSAWEPVLYATPKKRHPMTVEQFAELMPDDNTPMSLGEAFVKFGRLVEAYHDITGENTCSTLK